MNNEETALDSPFDTSDEKENIRHDEHEEEDEDAEDRNEFITIKMSSPPLAGQEGQEENENEIRLVESNPIDPGDPI